MKINIYKLSKLNSFKDKIRTVFYNDGLPAEETLCKAYLIILVYLVYRSNKSCYLQVTLEECKYMDETTKRFIA